MNKYLVRIELHRPTVKDPHERLHEIMEKAGFSRYIMKGTDAYHLPDAEYLGSSNADVNGVMAAVVALASQVPATESPGVFVVPFALYAWSGLKKVESARSIDVNEYLRQALAKKLGTGS
ncbi:hypothetical protein [Herbaspirillum sp. BH-1]|uniref:hypothetical protein n=1 Tax=Herbaspirillum sp. (strain BH-1) TaxID=2058884 RepID=UPI000C887F98|nr:hypothetical protein [Herbaspirillum sp. BH-1]